MHISQAEAHRRNVKFLTLEDVMSTNEIMETKEKINIDQVEGVNRCIYKSIVRILQEESKYMNLSQTSKDNYLDGVKIGNKVKNALHLRPSGRFQNFKRRVKNVHRKSVEVVLDVAHNIDAIKALREKMERTYPNAYVRYYPSRHEVY